MHQSRVLILGIGNPDDWNFKNGNYLFHGLRSVYHSSDIIREVGTSKTKATYKWDPVVKPGEVYDILFSIRGIDLYIYVNGRTLTYYPRSLSQFNGREVFWMGYQLPAGQSNLQATITEFTIEEK